VECADLRDIDERYFTVLSVNELYERADNHSIIDFIKETHLLSLIVMLVIFILY